MPTPNRLSRARQNIATLTRFLATSPRKIGVLSLVSFLRGATEAVVVVLVANVAISLSSGGTAPPPKIGPVTLDFSGSTTPVMLLALLLAGVMLGLHVLASRLSSFLTTTAMTAARKRLFSSYMQASWEVQANEQQGHLQDLLNTHVLRVQTGMTNLANLFSAIFNLTALLLTAVLVSPLAALGLLGAMVVLGSFFYPLTNRAKRHSKRHVTDNISFATSLTEAAGLAVESRVFNVNDRLVCRVDDAADEAAQPLRKGLFLAQTVAGAYQSVAIMLVVLSLLVVSQFPDLDLAAVGAIGLLMLRCVSYGQQIQTALHYVGDAQPYLDALTEQWDAYVAAAPVPGAKAVGSLDRFEFDDVELVYDTGAAALCGVSFEVTKGQAIGIVGPSGGGKSSLVQVVLRLREPTGGIYRINGTPAQEYDFTSWYEQTAFVPQTPRLYTGTIAENIRFFRDEISDEEVERAARRAHIHDEIVALPDGYQTEIKGIGGSVSGGQAQRICIARALAGSPSLVVLDEPTSALDMRSEALVQRTLEELKGQTTMLIVAHRLSTVRQCDHLMVIENGRLTATGKPNELLENEFFSEATRLSILS